jgi:hypothetical protein
MFESWLNGKGTKVKRFLLAGASVLVWAIWLSRNEIVFNKASQKSFIHVLFKATYWFRPWSQLEKHDEDKEKIKTACRSLEMVTLQIFNDHGWSTSKRICGS